MVIRPHPTGHCRQLLSRSDGYPHAVAGQDGAGAVPLDGPHAAGAGGFVDFSVQRLIYNGVPVIENRASAVVLIAYPCGVLIVKAVQRHPVVGGFDLGLDFLDSVPLGFGGTI